MLRKILQGVSQVACFIAATLPGASIADEIVVAIIADGPQYQFTEVADIFVDELTLLTQGEFELAFVPIQAEWTVESIRQAFDRAYADERIDMVLALGFAANQISASRPEFPKPTFLPLVFDSQVVGAPSQGQSSGRRNLSFLAERISIADEIATYQTIVDFDDAVVIIDRVILQALPALRDVLSRLKDESGVELTVVTHDGSDHEIAKKIPSQTGAVLYAGLPRLPAAEFTKLANELTDKGIPAFSLSDQRAVRNGMLASYTIETDWQRLARRNALNMQAVLLGESADNQPIFFTGKQELTINMATARALSLSPRFDILSEATLVNAEPPPSGIRLNLQRVGELALSDNLDVQVAALASDESELGIRVAKADLYPQLSLNTATTRRRAAGNVVLGFAPERSVDGSLQLNQRLYSDDIYSALDISRLSADAQYALEGQARLDAVQEATLAYVNALRAQTQLAIRQENLDLNNSNLDLARDRVRIGVSSNADVYRWQTGLANARSDVLQARAALDQSRDALKRTLNRPMSSSFQLDDAGISDAFSLSADEFDEVASNPRALGWIVDYLVAGGLSRAPELRALDAEIAAQERTLKNQRRDFWLPDFSLSTQLAENISQGGLGSNGIGNGLRDWSVSVNASIAVFTGGRRKTQLTQAQLALQRLRLNREATRDRLEQQIRANAHQVQADYATIQLSRQAADASKANLDLVTDSYARGTVGILDLLDAQNQSLSAALNAENAVYNFLDSAIRLQRAAGEFEFLISQAEQATDKQEFREYIKQREAELRLGRSTERSNEQR